jgi:hypothetical protein
VADSREIYNEEHLQWLRSKILEIARSILSGEVGVIAGARMFGGLSHQAGDRDLDFLFFIGLDSETDHLPIGDARQHWNPEVLRAKDAELAAYEAKVRDRAFKACRGIIQKYERHAA